MTERRLGPRAYVGVLVVAAAGGTAGQLFRYALAEESGGTVGASVMRLAVAVVGRRLVLDLAVGVPAIGRFGHL